MKKILVLMGGWSEEREVSLKSGKAVYNGLKQAGYDVVCMDLNRENIGDIIKIKPDVVFIALHGKFGEDGTVQGYLELAGIPYTGSGVEASAVCINKALSKKIFTYEGIPTAPYMLVTQAILTDEIVEDIKSQVGIPVVIKAATQGSSIGTYIVKEPRKIMNAIKSALTYSDEVVIEKYIDGIQLTVAVIGNQNPVILPPIEITSKNDFYDYESKYTPGMCEHIIPARIEEQLTHKIEEISKQVYEKMSCRGFARIDFMVDREGNPFVLEVNTIPGMTEMSLVPDAARAAGFTFESLVDKIIKLAVDEG